MNAPIASTSPQPGVRGIGWSFLLLVARVALAGVFLLAGFVKLSDPQSFAFSVKAFKILPDHLAILATFVFPWLEAICGVLLLLGIWTRPAAIVASLQLAAFIAGIISVLARGLNVSCGCFGKFDLLCSGPLSICNVGQNSLFLLLAIVLVAFGSGRIAVARD
jgi:uncharacterized membrane protein YphA (DoxX/SURF4 family)